MDQLYNYYVTTGKFVDASNVLYEKTLVSAHTFPTDFDSLGNNVCTTAASPYISNCKMDGAGNILKHIYGNLNPKRTLNRTAGAKQVIPYCLYDTNLQNIVRILYVCRLEPVVSLHSSSQNF